MKISGGMLGAVQLDTAFSAFDEMLGSIAHQRHFAATITGTAAASNKAIAEIQNPTGTTKNLYLFMGDLWVATAMGVIATFGGTSIAPAGVPIGQFNAVGTSVAKVGGSNQLAPAGSAFLTTPSLAINTPYLLPNWFWCALPPNSQLQFQGQVVNQAFTVNLRWIELSA